MWIVYVIVVFCLGAVFAWFAEAWNREWPKWISLATVVICGLITLAQFGAGAAHMAVGAATAPQWISVVRFPWIPQFGISLIFAVDGLSLLLVALTILLGIVAIVASWREIDERPGFFQFNLLLSLAGVTGVFVALDLFLFFVFWELMLIPMYFLIAIWGSENRGPAAIKFFLFMQVSGLLMLASILALAFLHQAHGGSMTFDYFALYGMALDPKIAFYLMLGFFIAFAVKLPAFPFHTWVADAYTEAPTAASILLAGILAKTGAYGLIRFTVPLFPAAAHEIAGIAMVMGVASVLYGAALAFAQTDFKRLIAYSSISHMGFIMIGVFAWNQLALTGSVIQMLAHGFSTGALFMIAGALSSRLHTRDMSRMGGLWTDMPRMGGIAMFFLIATLGMPGLGNFVGEFLILLGTYRVNVTVAVLTTLGLVTAVTYALIAMQKTFHGEPVAGRSVADSHLGETVTMALMMVALVVLGLYPQPVFHVLNPVLAGLSVGPHNLVGALP